MDRETVPVGEGAGMAECEECGEVFFGEDEVIGIGQKLIILIMIV